MRKGFGRCGSSLKTVFSQPDFAKNKSGGQSGKRLADPQEHAYTRVAPKPGSKIPNEKGRTGVITEADCKFRFAAFYLPTLVECDHADRADRKAGKQTEEKGGGGRSGKTEYTGKRSGEDLSCRAAQAGGCGNAGDDHKGKKRRDNRGNA